VTAEIIAVGSELLTPARMDTNSLFLTLKLNELGIDVVRKTIIGDDRVRLADEIRQARGSSRIVIMTGGIGPTLDDVSREAVSEALGLPLDYHPEITEEIEKRISSLGRHKMAEINKRQAFVLRGAEVLPNANGTAPGQWFEDDRGILMLLPGPPREIEPLFETQCLPRLRKLESPQQFYTASLRVAGLPESEVDQRIGPIYSAESRVATTILASPGEIQVHMRAQAATKEEAREIALALSKRVEAELGSSVFTRENEPLEAVLLRICRERKITMAVAESCTGGMIAEHITAIPGASESFRGAVVSYTDEAKRKLLHVSSKTLEEYGAVSRETAAEMAQGVRTVFEASLGVATTGIAGPAGGSEKTPLGTVFVAVADDDGVDVDELHIGGDRERVRVWATRRALNMMRRRLEGRHHPL
jgi:nicotinamide-nucleotide amidase